MTKYKVEFEISGTGIADNIPLNISTLKQTILNILNANDTISYDGNRDIDTIVTNLKVKPQRQVTLSRLDIELLKHGDASNADYVVDKILEQLGELDI